jgi:2-polyprenyl-3-methyl-5-hydroxy-6-metoxy-1,4-benzoquinol methylase
MDQQTQAAIYESLETLSNAEEYYKWLYSGVKNFIRGRVLEIGAGIGNFAKWAKDSATEYHVTDADSFLVEKLKKEFPKAFLWNLYEPFPGTDQYDTVIILNVIEHLEKDLEALRILHERLVPGGHLIIMVPAMQFLYGSLDRSFGHYRRYHKKQMQLLFERVPFTMIENRYVNVIGMFGWFLYGRILKKENLPEELCNRFNLVLPLLKLERPIAYFTGLSLMSVGRK